MRTFLISYALAANSTAAPELAQAMMTIGTAWARPLDTTWYVRARTTADELETMISQLLGDDDGLIVQEVAEDVAMANTSLRWFRQRTVAFTTAPNKAPNAPSATRETVMAGRPADVVPFPGRKRAAAADRVSAHTPGLDVDLVRHLAAAV